MGAGLVDKRDVGQLVAAELVAKRGNEFEAGGTATDDDNVMKIGSRTGHCSYLRSYAASSGDLPTQGCGAPDWWLFAASWDC